MGIRGNGVCRRGTGILPQTGEKRVGKPLLRQTPERQNEGRSVESEKFRLIFPDRFNPRERP